MTVSIGVREQVRRYANFACEFCGVTETDTGGELTIDHYQPKSKGGADSFDNLLSAYLASSDSNITHGATGTP